MLRGSLCLLSLPPAPWATFDHQGQERSPGSCCTSCPSPNYRNVSPQGPRFRLPNVVGTHHGKTPPQKAPTQCGPSPRHSPVGTHGGGKMQQRERVCLCTQTHAHTRCESSYTKFTHATAK